MITSVPVVDSTFPKNLFVRSEAFSALVGDLWQVWPSVLYVREGHSLFCEYVQGSLQRTVQLELYYTKESEYANMPDTKNKNTAVNSRF